MYQNHGAKNYFQFYCSAHVYTLAQRKLDKPALRNNIVDIEKHSDRSIFDWRGTFRFPT